MADPISLSMIVRKYGDDLEEAVMSVRDYVDEVCIYVTGSEGNALEKAKKLASPGKLRHDDELVEPSEEMMLTDFAEARNRCLDMVSKKWVIWLDADDRVVNGEDLVWAVNDKPKNWDLNASGLVLPWDYTINPEGKTLLTVMRERLVIASEYRWKWPAHELLIPKYDVGCGYLPEVKTRIRHTGDGHRDVRKGLILMERYLEKYGYDTESRVLYHMGKCLLGTGNLKRASEILSRHHDTVADPFFRYDGLIIWATCEINQLHYARAEELFLEAVRVFPQNPKAYYHLGHLRYLMRDWDRALAWKDIGDRLPRANENSYHLYYKPDYEELPLSYAHQCLFHLGQYTEAYKTLMRYKECILTREWDEELQDFEKRYREKVRSLEIRQAASTLKNSVGLDPVLQFIDDLPMTDEKTYLQKTNTYLTNRPPRPPEGKRTITFFCGSIAPEPWWAANEVSGTGGSELAVIDLAREFHRRGYGVEVFCNTPDALSAEFDGVRYFPTEKFIGRKYSNDIVIVWRSPVLLDVPFKAKKIFILMEDVPLRIQWDPWRVNRVDKIVLISEYHRTLFPDEIPDEKFVISRNPIHPQLYTWTGKKKSGQVIYGSAPTRGLLVLLEVWPYIKKEVPGATLKILYGFTKYMYDHANAFTRTDLMGSEAMYLTEYMERVKRLVGELDGVEFLGKVGRLQVAEILNESDIWAYPCLFPEVGCTFGEEAQAAGVIPVVTDFSALKDNVKFGYKLDVADINERANISRKLYWSPVARAAFAKGVVEALQHSAAGDHEGMRVRMSNWAKDTFSISRIADQWEQLFETVPDQGIHTERWHPSLISDESYREHIHDAPGMTHKDGKEMAEDPGIRDLTRMQWLPDLVRGKRVLEFGPQWGFMTSEALNSEVDSICIVDASDVWLEKLRLAMGENGCSEKLEFVHSFAEDLNLGRQFDVVLLCEVLEHVRDPDLVMISAMRHLADDGRMLLSVPNFYNGGLAYARARHTTQEHVRTYTPEEFEDFVSGYGVIEKSFHDDNCCTLILRKDGGLHG